MNLRLPAYLLFFFLLTTNTYATHLLIPMTGWHHAVRQKNGLKAYGVAYAGIQRQAHVEWLLNYHGGSFVMNDTAGLSELCDQRNVSYIRISDAAYDSLITKILDTGYDGNVVLLEKAPRIAVYTPINKRPWDDAVTLALTYAGIPFDKVYVDEVLAGGLDKYDWLHLHHEDFTGQFDKHWLFERKEDWYQEEVKTMRALAQQHDFGKVSQMELAVAKRIRDFVVAGGNLFAMCSATESLDVALAAEHTDICDTMYDGDRPSAHIQQELDYSNCLAFQNFKIITTPLFPWFSSININELERRKNTLDIFNLSSLPAKLDVTPVMLCQNHAQTIVGFLGQTTAFRLSTIKPGTMILGVGNEEARYIHGLLGSGTWTFLSGHDPEDPHHVSYSDPTDLSKHTNSPGYRLILNNVLVPAAKRTEVPTVTNSKTLGKPAPVAGKFRIDASVNELVITADVGMIRVVSIFDVSGKKLINNFFNSPEVTVPIKGLAPGTYFVQVNGSYAGKLVKVIN